MVKGILADNDVRGQVDYLGSLLRTQPWDEFWADLGLTLLHFEDVGLADTATDLEVWQRCQAEQLALVTGNRNLTGPDSLEATIRLHNTANSLPVFTIADVDKLNASRSYAEEVVESLLDYLQRMDTVRGTGRLFLP
jgi:predicted nuclease of predicted toxin-antitoxin system